MSLHHPPDGPPVWLQNLIAGAVILFGVGWAVYGAMLVIADSLP